jgi:DMSO/TMAO reductase YedYZ molybdopterin-dependent catalytic subunit
MRPGPLRRRWAATALVLLLVAAAGPKPAAAQAAPSAPIELALQGRLEHPRTLTLAELQATPPVTVKIERTTANGVQHESFTGASLWALLTAAVPVDEPGKHTNLQHTLLARGQDGYAVALAIGEMDPHFEGKQVLVAYAQDGQPLPALRLVIPADAHAGRSVRDLIAIEVR